MERRKFLEKILVGSTILALDGLTNLAHASPKQDPKELSKLIEKILKEQNINKVTVSHVLAVVEIESNFNQNASRHESNVNDTSYGLMQILTGTAKELKRKHPNLQNLRDPASSLYKPEINLTYGSVYLNDIIQPYLKDQNAIELAVAGYNAGPLTPRNARIQEQLNDLLNLNLTLNGRLKPKDIKTFQEYWNKHSSRKLEVDSILGQKTNEALQTAWKYFNPNKPNPSGIIPVQSLNHIKKFKVALSKYT